MKKRRLNILITAGATQEAIDPVRFISNYATGYFGFRIAQEAKRRGHRVCVVAAATTCARPQGIPAVDVQTAQQMKKELDKKFAWSDCLVMNAAVCDFLPAKALKSKIKKRSGVTLLKLRQAPDILKGLARKKGEKTLVGFALESEDLEKNARLKLQEKKLDFIVATLINKKSYPFGRSKLDALLIEKNGRKQLIKAASKTRLSQILLGKIEKAA